MYGTCETLCRELAVKYPGDMPLMLVIWSPEEIQALADGMDISLSDHEIRTVLARLEDIPEDQRTESGISGRARDGRFYRSRLASVTVYASPSPFSDERPSSRFRGIALPSKRRRLRYSTVGLTRYRTR
ncbi:Protein of uncharacterised function (DUF1380) [Shigella sonnei]|nr:Protein of uncharacterised function (DUF1380) [Shigella sonnei]